MSISDFLMMEMMILCTASSSSKQQVQSQILPDLANSNYFQQSCPFLVYFFLMPKKKPFWPITCYNSQRSLFFLEQCCWFRVSSTYSTLMCKLPSHRSGKNRRVGDLVNTLNYREWKLFSLLMEIMFWAGLILEQQGVELDDLVEFSRTLSKTISIKIISQFPETSQEMQTSVSRGKSNFDLICHF